MVWIWGGLALSDGLLEILDDSDGCTEQYRCATALYMLHKLAEEEDLVYDRAIDAEGHGKKYIDGLSGGNNNHISQQFQGNIIYQEEQRTKHKTEHLLCDMIDGKKVDFTDICKEMLDDPMRDTRVAPNESYTQRKDSEKKR